MTSKPTPTTIPRLRLRYPHLHIHWHHHIPPVAYLVVAGIVVAAVTIATARHRAKRRRRLVDRAVNTARHHLGDTCRLDNHIFGRTPIRWHRGKITMIRLRFEKDCHPARQADLAAAFARQFGQPVNCDWNHVTGRVRIERQPPTPTIPANVAHPALPLEPDRLPFAIADGGRIMSWHLAGNAPHALIIGPTGTGKTVALRGLVIEACRHGIGVDILDPKRASFRGLADWPNVRSVATEIDTMAAVIHQTWEEMEARYRNLHTRCPLRLLVVDELTELVARFREAHSGSGEHPAVVEWRSLVRLGREARVHLLCGLQRPDAALIGGETRSNFGLAVGLGALSPEAQRMIGASINVTADHQGRAVVVTGRHQTEVQMWSTPNPADSLSASERAVLTALRPLPDVSTTSLPAVSHPSPSAPAPTPRHVSDVPDHAHIGTSRQPGRNSRAVTAEKVAEMQALYDRGDLTVAQIAKQCGVGASTVHRYVRRDGRPVLRLVKDES